MKVSQMRLWWNAVEKHQILNFVSDFSSSEQSGAINNATRSKAEDCLQREQPTAPPSGCEVSTQKPCCCHVPGKTGPQFSKFDSCNLQVYKSMNLFKYACALNSCYKRTMVCQVGLNNYSAPNMVRQLVNCLVKSSGRTCSKKHN